MQTSVLLKKDDQRLPDYFVLTVNFITGKHKKYNVAEMIYIEHLTDDKGNILTNNYNTFRIWTFEDLFVEIPLASIESLEYDEKYTKIMNIRKELIDKNRG